MKNVSHTGWHKSSYSNSSANCVEVGVPSAARRTVAVRDTKQHGAGPVLEFPAATWRAFLARARAGEFGG